MTWKLSSKLSSDSPSLASELYMSSVCQLLRLSSIDQSGSSWTTFAVRSHCSCKIFSLKKEANDLLLDQEGNFEWSWLIFAFLIFFSMFRSGLLTMLGSYEIGYSSLSNVIPHLLVKSFIDSHSNSLISCCFSLCLCAMFIISAMSTFEFFLKTSCFTSSILVSFLIPLMASQYVYLPFLTFNICFDDLQLLTSWSNKSFRSRSIC